MSRRKFKPIRRKVEQKGFFSKKNMMSIFIVIIMVSSVIGFIYTGDSYTYNGHKFTVNDIKYQTKIDGKIYEFDFLPSDVENIPVENAAIDKIKSTNVLIMTFDAMQDDLATIDLFRFEMSSKLPAFTNILSISSAVHTEVETYALPSVSCANATANIPVMDIIYSNTTAAAINGNCIKVYARYPLDLIAIKDRLLYGVLDII